MSYLRGGTSPKAARRIYILVVFVCAVAGIGLQMQWMGRQSKVRLAPVTRFTGIINEQTQNVFCEECGGSGVLRSPHDEAAVLPCGVCFGLGLHRIRRLEHSDMMCSTCRGMGRIAGAEVGSASDCPDCDGRGLVVLNKKGFKITAKSVVCPHCGGIGSIRVQEEGQLPSLELCPVCFGLGNHWVRPMDDFDKLCSACGGMGREPHGRESLTASACEICGGRGLVIGGALADATPEAPGGAGAVPEGPATTEVEILY